MQRNQDIRIRLFSRFSVAAQILLFFIFLTLSLTTNYSKNDNSFISAYSQPKAYDEKNLAAYTSLDTSNPPISDGSSKQQQNLLVTSSNNLVKEASKYELTFRTQTRGTIAFIELKFPPGFQLGNVNLIDRSGIEPPLFFSTTTASLANGIIRLKVDPAQTIGAENIIKLDFGNIINSHVPGNNYHVAITTKDTKNNIIDGPAASAPFGLKENMDAEITTENSANKDNSIKESTAAEESNDRIIVGELNEDDGVTKDLILGAPSVDKDSVRNIVEAVIPCKPGETAVVGGYEVITNTNERPENNAVKVFVECVTL
jgi:hypothetical protein